MILETTVRVKLSECREPIRLKLADGNVIVLVIEDDRARSAPPPKKRWGNGRVYRRGSVWWIGYSRDGKERRKSSRSEVEADALELLKRCLTEGRADKPKRKYKSRQPGAHSRLNAQGAKKLNGKSYRCDSCNKDFPTAQAKGAHNRYHHPKKGQRQTRGWQPQRPEKKEYRCRPCNRLFLDQGALEDHQWEAHGVKTKKAAELESELDA